MTPKELGKSSIETTGGLNLPPTFGFPMLPMGPSALPGASFLPPPPLPSQLMRMGARSSGIIDSIENIIRPNTNTGSGAGQQ